MSALASTIGVTDQTFRIGEKTYRLCELTMADMEEFKPLLKKWYRFNAAVHEWRARRQNWRMQIAGVIGLPLPTHPGPMAEQRAATQYEIDLALWDTKAGEILHSRWGEPDIAAIGKPPEPPDDSDAGSDLNFYMTMLWAAIRKDGKTEDEIDAGAWNMSLPRLKSSIAYGRFREVVEIVNAFLGRTMTGPTPTVADSK